MARPIWTGTLSFGLLHIPIRLYSGETSADLHLRMLDGRNRKPVRYERINSETGAEVPWKDVVKAFEYRKGSYVVLDAETLAAAAPEQRETIALETFVDVDRIDPRLYEKPYLIAPDRKADKPYVLLRETLKKQRKVGIAKVVIRTRQYLSMLTPIDDALVLILMRFPQELVDPGDYRLPDKTAKQLGISAKELDMARSLVDSMSGDWDPGAYRDDFRDRIKAYVAREAKKADRRKGKTKGSADDVSDDRAEMLAPTGNDDDFMTLLRESLKGQRSTTTAGRSQRSTTRRRSRSPASRSRSNKAGKSS